MNEPRTGRSEASPDCNLAAQVAAVARAAGREIMAIYHGKATLDVVAKTDSSPLTSADLAADRVIKMQLPQIIDLPILSEEGAHPPLPWTAATTSFWLVDPLDGTREFLEHTGDFSVNIAWIVRGEPVLGVIYAPAHDRLYWGIRGGGSYCGDPGVSSPPLAVEPLPAKKLRLVLSRRVIARMAPLPELLPQFAVQMLPLGSALKFCHVASGVAHFYPRRSPISLWDTAAGQIILEEAGGQVVDRFGRPLGYSTGRLQTPPFLAATSCEISEWCDFFLNTPLTRGRQP